MKRTHSLFLILALLMLSPKSVHAIDEFKTEYQVIYDVQSNGETFVTQEIIITNLKDDVIATNYTLSVKQMQIYGIEATDQRGEMEVTEEIKEGTAIVKAKFNDNIIGKGRSNSFTFKYKTKDIATKIGEIYTIKIPQVADLDVVREYDVKLLVPTFFGPNIFITPEPDKYDEENYKYSYIFTKQDLEDKGISASFGKYQVFNYKLIYQLTNDSAFSSIHEITLPPDITERQQVNHKDIDPQPYKVYEDDDGNLLAQYLLKPRERKEITLIGSARILGRKINPELGGSFSRIPKDLKDDYLSERVYWEVQAPEVQALKNKLFDPDLNVTQNALQIYNYLVNNFKYDFGVIEKDYVERYGALKALNKGVPTACMEFTDIFISLARAMGIPARELNGYAINAYQKASLPLSIKLKSGDFLHAWPEFYDPNYGWVPVDPTWGNTSKLDFFTKLDNSHFVFVIKGLSSEHPLPVGLYRYDEDKQLVSVEVSENETEEDFKHFISLYKVINLNPLKLLTGYHKYLQKNEGGTYIYNLNGRDILPYEVSTIYLRKDLDILRYEDVNGELQTQSITLTDVNPRKRLVNPYYIIFSLFLGLGLCGFFYYLLVVKGYRKKLPRLLRRRPQDQDR